MSLESLKEQYPQFFNEGSTDPSDPDADVTRVHAKTGKEKSDLPTDNLTNGLRPEGLEDQGGDIVNEEEANGFYCLDCGSTTPFTEAKVFVTESQEELPACMVCESTKLEEVVLEGLDERSDNPGTSSSEEKMGDDGSDKNESQTNEGIAAKYHKWRMSRNAKTASRHDRAAKKHKEKSAAARTATLKHMRANRHESLEEGVQPQDYYASLSEQSEQAAEAAYKAGQVQEAERLMAESEHYGYLADFHNELAEASMEEGEMCSKCHKKPCECSKNEGKENRQQFFNRPNRFEQRQQEENLPEGLQSAFESAFIGRFYESLEQQEGLIESQKQSRRNENRQGA